MSSLARITFLKRTRVDQVLALSCVLRVMRKILVLKHWHDASLKKRHERPAAGEAVNALIEEACVDSCMLALKTVDGFFRPASTNSRATDDTVHAAQFGCVQEGGFLSRERREELSRLSSQIVSPSPGPAFHASLGEDLTRAAAPCHRFLTWLLATDFLEDEKGLAGEAASLAGSFQEVLDAPSESRLEMPEDVVRATGSCLRAAKSGHAAAFTRLVKDATRRAPAAKPNAPGVVAREMTSFAGGIRDLDDLVHALEAVQASLGEGSEAGRIVNWLLISWTELRRKVSGGGARTA